MNIATTLPDIPRAYTAIAESLSCLIYILILPKRVKGIKLAAAVMLTFAVQFLTQKFAGTLPLSFWIFGMLLNVLVMFSCIIAICDISARDGGYCCARAFVLAEFAASLEWQLHCYFFSPVNAQSRLITNAFMLLVFSVVFAVVFWVEARHMPKNEHLHISYKELWSASAIALSAFLISNLSFVYVNTPFSGRLAPEIFYIRTLVDFGGFVILYAQQEQRRESYMKRELEAINNILHRQFEQYQQSKESIELINRKYHDLKHQIAVIRAEENPQKKEAYLAELENGIKTYEAQNKTGHSVLDTVLTTKSMFCVERGITMTCVADGTLLKFMDVMDICTIFGNALDNAIESVSKIEDADKRLIRVAVYTQNNFLMMRFENYYESELKVENGFFKTTKPNKGYHGYGIKSIKYTAEKYDGSITVHAENGWFILRILIPLP